MELMTTKTNLYMDMEPDKLIENYSSLIWTERYSRNGDFELNTTEVEETLNLLPLESIICIRESRVPMVVEQHKIEKKPGAAATLKVLGRSFETVLERRAAINGILPNSSTPSHNAWLITAAKESDAAYQAIRLIIGDVLREEEPFGFLSPTDPILDPYDAMNIEQPLPADYEWSYPNSYEIPPGLLYPVVIDLLNANHHGLKATRPLRNDGGGRVSIEIYNGADLTEGPDAVVFDARFDQFDSATYLLSKLGSANIAYIYGPNGAQKVMKNTIAEPEDEVTGLERRVSLIDAVSDTTANSVETRTSRAIVDLYSKNVTALFDGQISVQVAEGYNHDYFLGDIIKLNGEYGLSQNVRVAEFIRSDDATGEKAYPAFEAVDG